MRAATAHDSKADTVTGINLTIVGEKGSVSITLFEIGGSYSQARFVYESTCH